MQKYKGMGVQLFEFQILSGMALEKEKEKLTVEKEKGQEGNGFLLFCRAGQRVGVFFLLQNR